MKKNYLEPEIYVEHFSVEEVILASGNNSDDPDDIITLPVIPAP